MTPVVHPIVPPRILPSQAGSNLCSPTVLSNHPDQTSLSQIVSRLLSPFLLISQALIQVGVSKVACRDCPSQKQEQSCPPVATDFMVPLVLASQMSVSFEFGWILRSPLMVKAARVFGVFVPITTPLAAFTAKRFA